MSKVFLLGVWILMRFVLFMINIKSYEFPITKLEPNEVFVFGSNLSGFHGAGSAGYATFGVFGNVWRSYDYGNIPNGTKGLWNVKGIAEGYQEGTIGKSYAIPTVTRPGAKRSVPLFTIKKSIDKFYNFAIENPNLNFKIAFGGSQYNGYTLEELGRIWYREDDISNVYFLKSFIPFLIKESTKLI